MAKHLSFTIYKLNLNKASENGWVKYCCSVTQSCHALCDPMDCSMPGFLILHCLPELAETLIYWVSDAIQPSHPLSPSSPLALNHSQHQGLFQWVGFSHQVAKVWKFHLQRPWLLRATKRSLRSLCTATRESSSAKTNSPSAEAKTQRRYKKVFVNICVIKTPFSSVQSLSRVQLFATLWTTACQASLSITNFQSPPKPMSI